MSTGTWWKGPRAGATSMRWTTQRRHRCARKAWLRCPATSPATWPPRPSDEFGDAQSSEWPQGCQTHERGTTMTAMVVSLPVTDLERAKAFYTAIGFTIDFTDH